MIAVIFEGWTDAAHSSGYLELAAKLRPLLDDVPGFISVERFQSLADPQKLLSLSFWQDEAAVAAWRNTAEHRTAQAVGRAGVFRDYHVRITEISREYGLADRADAPPDSKAAHTRA